MDAGPPKTCFYRCTF